MREQTMQDIETMADWVATQQAYQRMLERRAQRRRSWHFWICPLQVVYEPTVAASTSEVTGSPSTSDVGPGAVRVESETVDPSRVGGRGAPRTALPPLPASRISGGITWQ